MRVALALASPTLETAFEVPSERKAGQQALDAATLWLQRPSNGQQLTCQRAGDLAATTAAESSPSIGARPAGYHALMACSLVAYAAGSAIPAAAADGCFGCARHATLAQVIAGALNASESAAGKVLHPQLRSRVEHELIAWAVGDDPEPPSDYSR